MKAHLSVMKSVMLKDWRLLWPLVLVTAALLLLQSTVLTPTELRDTCETASTIAASLLVLATVQLDAPASLRHDWLTRPISPGALLGAKVGFLLLALVPPSMVGAFVLAQGDGLDASAALDAIVLDHVIALALGAALMAVGAVTTRLVDAAGAIVAATLFALATMYLVRASGLSGPTVAEEGQGWGLVGPLAAIVLTGTALTLWLQYWRRQTALARSTLTATTMLFALAAAWVGAVPT